MQLNAGAYFASSKKLNCKMAKKCKKKNRKPRQLTAKKCEKMSGGELTCLDDELVD